MVFLLLVAFGAIEPFAAWSLAVSQFPKAFKIRVMIGDTDNMGILLRPEH